MTRTRRKKIKYMLYTENPICFYCKTEVSLTAWKEPFFATLDHLWPKSLNGGNYIGNLALSCASCNIRKGSRTMDEILNTISFGIS